MASYGAFSRSSTSNQLIISNEHTAELRQVVSSQPPDSRRISVIYLDLLEVVRERNARHGTGSEAEMGTTIQVA
jgi:hypothetical protein